MTRGQVQRTDVHEVLRPVNDGQPLMTLIENMALEIARLSEDNTQLRAAVAMYREALRRYTGEAVPPARG